MGPSRRAARLLNQLRARVEAEDCAYRAELDRLEKIAQQFDREAELDRLRSSASTVRAHAVHGRDARDHHIQ
jgi:hypothetical protein